MSHAAQAERRLLIDAGAFVTESDRHSSDPVEDPADKCAGAEEQSDDLIYEDYSSLGDFALVAEDQIEDEHESSTSVLLLL